MDDRSIGGKPCGNPIGRNGRSSRPPPLPMSLDDDGDAVSAHDAQESEYYQAYDSSTLTRGG